jgi:hypothetical protein
MAIVLDGTTGITTPALDSTARFAIADMPLGSVIQVVQGSTSTGVSSSTSTLVDTGLTATITPSSASNKVLVIVNHAMCFKSEANGANGLALRLLRASTTLTSVPFLGYNGVAQQSYFPALFVFLDSPATDSAVTYKTQFNSAFNTASVSVQAGPSESTITLIEVAA